MDVRAGARVRVDGLKARPELNGMLGTVESHNEATGRWNVMVDDMREALALKLDALTVDESFAGIVVGTRVRIAGLEKKEELNGKTGVCARRPSSWSRTHPKTYSFSDMAQVR